MKNSQRFWRGLFFFLLIAAMCGGLALPVVEVVPVHAAPQMRASTSVVVSEFRTRGPNGGNDEFIELYNISSGVINVGNWSVSYSNSGGDLSDRYTFPAGSSLSPGQYFLLANNGSNGYSGSTTPDATYTQSIANDGGIALIDGADNIIDQVGMSSGSVYKEPSSGSGILAPLTADINQSYEREPGGNAGNCYDTDNNAADFLLNSSSSNPQNTSSTPMVSCVSLPIVTNVSSTAPDYPYIHNSGATIDITITFSSVVSVSGSPPPTLLLETGATDRTAVYQSGSDSNILTFRYTVMAGDSSVDLDYVSANSLTLNGGTITGVSGNAILTLPSPGTTGSLGANNNIVIDNDASPTVTSIRRQSPSSELTNADTLTFRVTFSEDVDPVTVNAGDFLVTGTTGIPAVVTRITDSIYDVDVSGGDLATLLTGTVGLDLSGTQDIMGRDGNTLLLTPPPSVDETYTMDNIAPTVIIGLASGQVTPTSQLPVNFTVVFSEAINVSSFTVSDITQSGTAGSVVWTITADPAGSTTNFRLSATSMASDGTLIPSIAANRVRDLAGNGNDPVTGATVDFQDDTRPTVTIDQATGQADPTGSLPIRFTIVFSEPIDTGVFQASDIRQTGSATGITWSIADSGNHTTFTLSATAVTGIGTLVPTIRANSVRDLAGNNNLDSTSTDNSVTYTSGTSLGIVISEFRTQGPNGASDEFIELYNPTSSYVDISGWKVNVSTSSGGSATRATIPASTILRSGQYYLIANNSTNGYSSSVPADQTYATGITDDGGIALLNSSNTTVDQVGMSTGSTYKEGTTLTALSGNLNQSYERELGGTSDSCQDTSNNVNDFSLITPSNPQNYLAPLSLCGTPRLNPVNTTTTITADTPDPSLINGYVDVSVSVTGGSAPTGKVNITGASTNCSITLNSAGTGTCTVRFTISGTRTLTATYLGDNTHYKSSDTETHTITYAVPTRTKQPTPVPPPPLVGINEFVPRPGHDWNNDGLVNTGDEYIELINHGVVDVNLSGYRLDDEANIGSEPYSLPSVTLKPGERKVFYGKETGLLLSDGGDGVRLLKSNGQLADAYNYSVVRFPDQSYCRLPDNGGLDDWTEFCSPTPGLQNTLGSSVNPPAVSGREPLCPIADTLPDDFAFAECQPFGHNIWNSVYWDRTGWFDEKNLPGSPGKSPVFAE